MPRGNRYPEVVSVEEFARIVKLSPEQARNLIRKGEIAAIRIGKEYRIPHAVSDRYFAQALPPEERGYGMWKRKPVRGLTYVNELRKRDRRTPEVFLKDMAEGK